MRKVYVVGGKRTAIGKFLGSLSAVKPGDMCAPVVKQVLEDTEIDLNCIDEIIIGYQYSAGQGPSIARRIQRQAGIPDIIPATTINMQCGSGLKAAILSSYSIQAGNEVVLCGGVENMSQVPYLITNKVRQGVKMGNEAVKVEDSLYCDGLIDQFYHYMMGNTAENVAKKMNISREEQDRFAVISQNRAQTAVESGRFDNEIVPIHYLDRKKTEIIFSRDESYTPDTTYEKLSKLRPAFQKDGTVTAGNSSQLNDGAAALLLASEDAVKKYNLKPIAEIISSATVGIDPSIMGLGPVKTIIKTLDIAGMRLQDVELIELNEAFAAQALGCIKGLGEKYGISDEAIIEKTNVNGGAIALGHPVAATGSRIVVSLLNEMNKRHLIYGLASLCVGGGMGTAMLFKMCR